MVLYDRGTGDARKGIAQTHALRKETTNHLPSVFSHV